MQNTNADSNTTIVKVKFKIFVPWAIRTTFKYNDC